MSGYLKPTRKRIVTFDQFDVVVVPFPFTDTSGSKKRPALVLSDAVAFNTLLSRSVMAMITTRTHAPWVLDVPITDLSSAGLKAASIVRMKLFTLDDALVLRHIGTLAEADKAAVKQALQQLFNW
nr:type II toxin-antitoxin system PemK/MazF family toxin [Brasilonema octagenarum]